MKRRIAILLVLCMALSLAACGGSGTKTPEPTEAPKAAEAPAAAAGKARMTAEEIAAAIDKAETAEGLNKLIESLEGAYGETEKITVGGESITLAELRQMAELFAAIGSGGDEPGGAKPAGTPVSPEAAAKAAGEWTGVYCKFVGDEDGITDEPFSLTLDADGTGTHSRDDLEISVTWALDGEDFTMTETFMGMTIDYTGTLENGVLHLFNGDPTDDFTYEYVYGQGDVSGIEVPHGAAPDTSALGRFRGDWNGALLFTECTGKYEYLDDGVPVGAIARFAVRADGSIEPFIGIDVEDTPFEDLSASYSDFWEELTISGKWINVPFEGVTVQEKNGTLHVEIPIAKEAGSLRMVMNFRRLDDEGWTDESPRLGAKQIEACKGMSFGELAGLLGYRFLDYPDPDEG